MKDPFYTQRLPFAGPSYEGNPILKIAVSSSQVLHFQAYDKSL
jgi:hypothetical protein